MTTQYACHNEFRSDTFTVPTQSMIEAISTASVGDSVYDEDVDTIQLEEKVAKIAGKEAGLFCVSGTLSNQIALRTHLVQPPHRILCDWRAHVYMHEAGGLATLSQAMVSPVCPSNGLYLTLEDVIANFIPDDEDIHMAPTRVVSLENTIHGIIMPLDEIKKISSWCNEMGVKLHLDGARLWNASVETGISMKEYCSYFDSVSLCLSKSLGAPIGSVLVGDRSFLKKANHFKKQNGGGIRQAGFIARMASIAIDENLEKLKDAHSMAKEVGDFCQSLGMILDGTVDTNFVFLNSAAMKFDTEYFVEAGQRHNVKLMGGRIAFHFENSRESVENLKKAIAESYEYSLEHPYEYKGVKRIYNSSPKNSKCPTPELNDV